MKPDNDVQERRSNFDRRQFYYSAHLPERRKNGDRRKNKEKRDILPFLYGEEEKVNLNPMKR